MARKKRIRVINVTENDIIRSPQSGLGDASYLPWWAFGSETIYDSITQPRGINPVTGEMEQGGLMQTVDDTATSVKDTVSNAANAITSDLSQLMKWAVLGVVVYYVVFKRNSWE
jgi:hypothetical protein